MSAGADIGVDARRFRSLCSLLATGRASNLASRRRGFTLDKIPCSSYVGFQLILPCFDPWGVMAFRDSY
jgi:hypothetical protein